MQLSSPGSSVFCPGGRPVADAFRSTRQLGVVAHADDLEIAAIKGILDCFDAPEPAFSGIVVCDGLGAPGRAGTDAEYGARRRQEQERAATLGRYAAVVFLDHPSARVRAAEAAVASDLDEVLAHFSPELVYTHSLLDAHDTHVAVALQLIEALRRQPPELRPRQVIGCEVWRDLDWLPEPERMALDVGERTDLQRELIRVFASQTEGKRYELATMGRRQAHATFRHPDRADETSGLVFGVDLTPLLAPDAPTAREFALGLVDALRRDVEERFARLTGC